MYNIKTINKISPVGLDKLKAKGCNVGENIAAPDGIIVRSADMHDYEVNPELLGVARAGAGYNNIPIDELAEKGIVVFNSPGANAEAVKEQTVCSMVLASRDVVGSIEWVKSIADQGDKIPTLVEKGKSNFAGPELMGKTVGVLGLGATGALVANACLALDMDVIGYDPFMSVEAAWRLSRDAKRADDIGEIFRNCDYISINIPYNEDTHHMLDAKAFAAMRDGVSSAAFSSARSERRFARPVSFRRAPRSSMTMRCSTPLSPARLQNMSLISPTRKYLAERTSLPCRTLAHVRPRARTDAPRWPQSSCMSTSKTAISSIP